MFYMLACFRSKISRTTSRSANTRNATSDSLSRVTPLSKAKDSPENRSFFGLDYDLMRDMFKGRGRLLLDAARALQDSPPTISDFNFSESNALMNYYRLIITYVDSTKVTKKKYFV